MIKIGVRWTVGNVHPVGLEALRLSIWGAWRLFGPQTRFVVCVNSIHVSAAKRLTGPVPEIIRWREVDDEVPEFIRRRLAPNMAEGAGWKFAPLRMFPDRFELSLDNDCILWDLPAALRASLAFGGTPQPVIAADVQRMFGKFSEWCGPEPRNSGLRGLPPGFDLETRLRRMLERVSEPLDSKHDERGLQVAALQWQSDCRVVEVGEVAICSPFPDHRQEPGTCGAHFVGLNAWDLPWQWRGRPASHWTREFWKQQHPAVHERVQYAAAFPLIG